MNQATYQEYLRRLPEEDPLKICRICIQETQKLIANSDPEWSDIHSRISGRNMLKKRVRIEKKKNIEHPIIISVEQTHFKSFPQETDPIFVQSSNVLKLENNANDMHQSNNG